MTVDIGCTISRPAEVPPPPPFSYAPGVKVFPGVVPGPAYEEFTSPEARSYQIHTAPRPTARSEGVVMPLGLVRTRYRPQKG